MSGTPNLVVGCATHHSVNSLLDPLGEANHSREQVFTGIKSKSGTPSKLRTHPSLQEGLFLRFRTTTTIGKVVSTQVL